MKNLWKIILFLPLFFVAGCDKDQSPSEDVKEEIVDHQTINQFLDYSYISKNNPNLIPTILTRDKDRILKDAIVNFSKQKDAKKYIKYITKNFGYPIWDRNTPYLSDTKEQEFFVPLSFPNSTSITAVLTTIQLADDSFYFHLVTKDKVKYHLENGPEQWENFTFYIFEIYEIDKQLFGYKNENYVEFLTEYEESNLGPIEPKLKKRGGCQEITTTVCREWTVLKRNKIETRGHQLCYTTTEVVCEEVDGGGSCLLCGGGSSGGDGSGGGSTGDGGLTEDEQIFANTTLYESGTLAASGEVLDISTKLNCFNTNNNSSGTHSISIFTDQPNPETRDAYTIGWNTDVDVGHTFISLEQNINGITTRLVFGFYPKDGVNPMSSPGDESVIRDDGGHSYDIGAKWSISPTEFNQLISNIKGNNNSYHLNNYNCTDYGIEAINSFGPKLPTTNGEWPFGGGRNPGDLGEDIRQLNSQSGMIKLNAGTAPSSKNC